MDDNIINEDRKTPGEIYRIIIIEGEIEKTESQENEKENIIDMEYIVFRDYFFSKLIIILGYLYNKIIE